MSLIYIINPRLSSISSNPFASTMYDSKKKSPLSMCVFFFLLYASSNAIAIANAVTTTTSLDLKERVSYAKSTCKDALYEDLCVSSLLSFPSLPSQTLPFIISSLVSQAANLVKIATANCTGIKTRLQPGLDAGKKQALDDCLELLDITQFELGTCQTDLNQKFSSKYYFDLETLLSAAITNQYTCLYGFSDVNGATIESLIEGGLKLITQITSNSLAILNKIPKPSTKENEVFSGYGAVTGGFPAWFSPKNRKLLQNGVTPNVVVAKDGSGNFLTVSAAVTAAPDNSNKRFVIYIKQGRYEENVEVGKKKINLMFVGDGIGKTVITGRRNVVDGSTTFRSATVAIVGNGFIARDITFENSAGPAKHQAVALRSGADLSVFYRCSFLGYQDTLYVHSLRQFYRECDIYGTVDFIFGNAAVVFQNCNLFARKPDPNQKNMITAQGREDPNQNTGISIQNCTITAAPDLVPVKSSFKSFLGRPWKAYSRTVYIQSFIDDLIDPLGWSEWSGSFGLNTLYYGEYINRGPGSDTSRRVRWPGYRVIRNSSEAAQFTASSFIQGNQWLPSSSVPFASGLI